MWPIEKLAKMLKLYGVKRIIVDGAHGPGQVVDLNLEELGQAGVDFYVGNLHKWAFAPRGCAVLWTMPELQDSTLPLVTGHCHKKTYQDRFFQQVNTLTK